MRSYHTRTSEQGKLVHNLNALNFLRQQGFKYLKSVKGREKRRGRITAWSEEIDSNVPRY